MMDSFVNVDGLDGDWVVVSEEGVDHLVVGQGDTVKCVNRQRVHATVRHSIPKEENLADTEKTQGKTHSDLADTGRSEFKSSPKLICMADVKSEPIDWLWEGRIPSGRISLLVGMPGIGKSFLTTDMAARVSTGTPWPDGHPCEQGSVLFVTAEDDPGDTIKPRLDAAKADSRRIQLLSGVIYSDGESESERMFDLRSVEILEQSLATMDDCRLVVIDPIGSFLGGGTDAHRDNEVRSVLAPVAQIAEKSGAAVFIVAHRRKAISSSADDMALGSRAFTGIARAVWHLTKDAEDDERRLLLPGKNNLARKQTGLAFTIAGEPPSIQWEDEPVLMSADDALALEGAKAKQGTNATSVDEAKQWLADALAKGPQVGNEVKEAAIRAGIKGRTLERARTSLGVVARPQGFGLPWKWELTENLGHEFTENSENPCVSPVSANENSENPCVSPVSAKSSSVSATVSANENGKKPCVSPVSAVSANLFITEDDSWPN